MSSIHELTATVRAPAYALSGADGQIVGGMHGVFVDDLRVLSEARLQVDGVEPQALTAVPEGAGRTRFVSVAPALGDYDDPDPTVRLERLRVITPDGMWEEIHLRSTATRAVHAIVTVDLRCDLAPLAALRAGQTRPALAPRVEPQRLVWTAEEVSVTATADAVRPGGDPGRLQWAIDLPPGGRVTVQWILRIAGRTPLLVMPPGPVEWARPRVVADEPRLARLLAQSMEDLTALRLAEATEPGSTFLGAGVPWFLTLFGRDSLWAARMMLPLGTGLAEGTLRVLARRQGVRVDPVTGEAPGKIVHELRHDDIQQSNPDALPPVYYGTVDATLLWISLLAEAWRWGMPERVVAELLPHLDRALSWLDSHRDEECGGFVAYFDRSSRGLPNQGWKDARNAVRFHDGTLARPPIALCEVQGYAHRAALDAAELLDAFGSGEPQRWQAYAAGLHDRFRRRFWVSGPLGPQPALAIDGDGRPVDSLTSNIGHLLGTGLLSREEEGTVAALLAHPAMAGGYGLRTMSTLDKGYAPLSYHCGSVWPHDTAITLLALAEAGARDVAVTLLQGLLAAAEAFDYRLPELYGGEGPDEVRRPLPYPAACRPQAWSAAAAVTILQAVLGLNVHVPHGEVSIQPLGGLGQVAVEDLRIAGSRVDIAVNRAGGVTVLGLPERLTWVDRRHDVERMQVPAPKLPAQAGPGERDTVTQ